MQRESHLFACHKYLEETGSQILNDLAKADFRASHVIEVICHQLQDYVTTLMNHAHWEEAFIFSRFFTHDDILSLVDEHHELECSGRKIINEFKMLLNVSPESRLSKGKLLYLDFRKFYATNLVHFYDEETTFLSMLQDRATDDEIRAIDQPVYQNMSAKDIVQMLEQLLPPANIFDKKNILEDLKSFNPSNFELALPEIQKLLQPTEATEILHEINWHTSIEGNHESR